MLFTQGAINVIRSIQLRDGRRLGYAEHGDSSGQPVFLFHGTPGSRLARHPDDDIARALGARVITVDRPGYGLSDPQPARTLLDWPADVGELADALGVPNFAVIGVSGGGPYAAACAYRLPDRVTHASLVCSPAPPLPAAGDFTGRNRAVFKLAARRSWLLSVLVRLMAWQLPATPEKLAAQLGKSLPACDAPVLELPGMADVMWADTQAAFRGGIRATVRDLQLTVMPWGFDLSTITVPTAVWHGKLDENVPVAMGRYLAQSLPHCQATFIPNAGHLISLSHWQRILAEAVS